MTHGRFGKHGQGTWAVFPSQCDATKGLRGLTSVVIPLDKYGDIMRKEPGIRNIIRRADFGFWARWRPLRPENSLLPWKFPGHSMGRQRPGSTQYTPWVDRLETATIHRKKYWKGGSCPERTPEICRGLSRVFSRALINACEWRNYQRPRKSTLQKD